MRFLLDENMSPVVADLLVAAGHHCVHVRDVGLVRATDRQVLDHARTESCTLVSADTDFGDLLARSGGAAPSVILLRREGGRRASTQAALIVANLDQITSDLETGAIVVVETTRVRVRRLPITPDP